LLIIIPSLGIRYWLWATLPNHMGINASYALNGLTFFLPLLLLLFKTHFQHTIQIVGAIVCFAIALYFRQVDAHDNQYLPMGTHFLWHIFTGFGGFFLGSYLYFLHGLLRTIKGGSLNDKPKESPTPIRQAS